MAFLLSRGKSSQLWATGSLLNQVPDLLIAAHSQGSADKATKQTSSWFILLYIFSSSVLMEAFFFFFE